MGYGTLNFLMRSLGKASIIGISSDAIVFAGCGGSAIEVNQRKVSIRHAYDSAITDFDREKLLERLHNISLEFGTKTERRDVRAEPSDTLMASTATFSIYEKDGKQTKQSSTDAMQSPMDRSLTNVTGDASDKVYALHDWLLHFINPRYELNSIGVEGVIWSQGIDCDNELRGCADYPRVLVIDGDKNSEAKFACDRKRYAKAFADHIRKVKKAAGTRVLLLFVNNALFQQTIESIRTEFEDGASIAVIAVADSGCLNDVAKCTRAKLITNYFDTSVDRHHLYGYLGKARKVGIGNNCSVLFGCEGNAIPQYSYELTELLSAKCGLRHLQNCALRCVTACRIDNGVLVSYMARDKNPIVLPRGVRQIHPDAFSPSASRLDRRVVVFPTELENLYNDVLGKFGENETLYVPKGLKVGQHRCRVLTY